MVFSANSALVLNNKALIAKMAAEPRRAESEHFASWFREQGFEVEELEKIVSCTIAWTDFFEGKFFMFVMIKRPSTKLLLNVFGVTCCNDAWTLFIILEREICQLQNLLLRFEKYLNFLRVKCTCFVKEMQSSVQLTICQVTFTDLDNEHRKVPTS